VSDPVTLADQMEAGFGRILHGWNKNADGVDLPFQVVECRNDAGQTIFSTLGLSRTALWSEGSAKAIRVELIMATVGAELAQWMPRALADLGSIFLGAGQPPLRGNYFDFGGPLFDGAIYQGIYFTIPVFLPEEFHLFVEAGEPVVVVWCVPITLEEIALLDEVGWPALEERFAADPEMLVKFRQ
jgi:hypothetical protein